MSDEVTFTTRELDVMSILWQLGSGTVREVREVMRNDLNEDLGYTSVLKFLQILEKKGHVRHEREGRAYRYHPTVDAQTAGRTALGRVVDKIFHGSAEAALARLVEDRPPSLDEAKRMRRLMDQVVKSQK